MGPRRHKVLLELYGQWLVHEAARYDLTALPARPWENVLERICAAIE
jgi:hypothetical protein